VWRPISLTIYTKYGKQVFRESLYCHAPSKSRIFGWIQEFREYGTVQNLNSKNLRDTYFTPHTPNTSLAWLSDFRRD